MSERVEQEPGGGRREPDGRLLAADNKSIIPAEIQKDLVTSATRAPSVHNTQPWQFRFIGNALELHADPRRRLEYADPDGREMLISCGAALFGMRLAIHRMGLRPVVELLPSAARPDLLARVRLGAASPFSIGEQVLWNALRRRHTHRGPFTGEPLPAGLLTVLQRQAEAEGGTLVLVRQARQYSRLATLVAAADQRQRRHPTLAAELRTWTRPAESRTRDGISPTAYVSRPADRPHALAQRDFDLGRGWGRLAPDGGDPMATAVLTTAGDRPADWLRAGQALHRLLLRAAADWVFATLHTQPLEIAPVRTAIRTQMGLTGAPQMVLQLGRAHIAPITTRRPADELIVR